MPIFAQGETRHKLSILYYLSASDLDLTHEQLYRAMVENDCMSYFDFQSAMHELEESGFIAAIPRAFGQGYRVSARGAASLEMFSDSLPNSLREQLQRYADQNRDTMLRETQLVSEMEERDGGGYRVTLKAQEKNTVVLSIDMTVASRDMALRIRSQWPDQAESIYAELLKKLL